jgi:hypothetical protein
MGGQDELAAGLNQPAHFRQHGQLPGRRQGGLRLVEQIQPISAQPVVQQGEKALPMRTGVRASAIGVPNKRRGGRDAIQLVDGGGHVVKALRPQEVPVPRG